MSIFKLVGGFYIGWAIQNRPQPSSWDLNVKQNETPVELASQNPKGTSKTMFDKISTKKQIPARCLQLTLILSHIIPDFPTNNESTSI